MTTCPGTIRAARTARAAAMSGAETSRLAWNASNARTANSAVRAKSKPSRFGGMTAPARAPTIPAPTQASWQTMVMVSSRAPVAGPHRVEVMA